MNYTIYQFFNSILLQILFFKNRGKPEVVPLYVQPKYNEYGTYFLSRSRITSIMITSSPGCALSTHCRRLRLLAAIRSLSSALFPA